MDNENRPPVWESVSWANRRYEQYRQGTPHERVPFGLCVGTELDLSVWSLVATDNRLKRIADDAIARGQCEIEGSSDVRFDESLLLSASSVDTVRSHLHASEVPTQNHCSELKICVCTRDALVNSFALIYAVQMVDAFGFFSLLLIDDMRIIQQYTRKQQASLKLQAAYRGDLDRRRVRLLKEQRAKRRIAV